MSEFHHGAGRPSGGRGGPHPAGRAVSGMESRSPGERETGVGGDSRRTTRRPGDPGRAQPDSRERPAIHVPTPMSIGSPDDPPWSEAELTITTVSDDLDRLVTEWPGVASWRDPYVDHDVDHEVTK